VNPRRCSNLPAPATTSDCGTATAGGRPRRVSGWSTAWQFANDMQVRHNDHRQAVQFVVEQERCQAPICLLDGPFASVRAMTFRSRSRSLSALTRRSNYLRSQHHSNSALRQADTRPSYHRRARKPFSIARSGVIDTANSGGQGDFAVVRKANWRFNPKGRYTVQREMPSDACAEFGACSDCARVSPPCC
jgi:hypothetical protein